MAEVIPNTIFEFNMSVNQNLNDKSSASWFFYNLLKQIPTNQLLVITWIMVKFHAQMGEFYFYWLSINSLVDSQILNRIVVDG